MNPVPLLIIILLSLYTQNPSNINLQSDPCSIDTLADTLRVIEELNSKYVDTSGIVDSIDKLVKACGVGDNATALYLYSNISSTLSKLISSADHIYWANMISRVIISAILLSIPALTYLYLPKIYLYLWFITRRKWLVVRRK